MLEQVPSLLQPVHVFLTDGEFDPEEGDESLGAVASAPERISELSEVDGSAPERISQLSPVDGPTPETPRVVKNSRHIPAAIRRVVWARDGGCCTFSDASGRRCHERSGLEIHHEHAFALGGSTAAENLRLLCRAHNALFAERDFGHAHVERMRNRRRRK